MEGAARRIRPKLMAVLTTMIGLVPVMWSAGTGADVMKRIAAPMVGGLVSSFALQLTIYPAIFAIWKGRAHADDSKPEHPGRRHHDVRATALKLGEGRKSGWMPRQTSP